MTQKSKELKMAEKEATILEYLLQDTVYMEGQTRSLKTAEHNLSIIQSFMVKLTPLGGARESMYSAYTVHLKLTRGTSFGILGSSFNASTDLFRAVLCRDLDGDSLKDSGRWDRIRDHSAIQRMLPFSVSNPAPAKQMRAIAGLAMYSRALDEFAFQPS
ncbi:hypothetical protein FOMG_17878 [Fusarium oxysporum f. sp. melonis 26406]|uniref:Uncharacterized protein n=1 Tax=Fusarium oxysporum f. sp. melonis 26406 TaxID=1089452 RepID=W9ZWM8_FUSOX|nr:hypothetical protein FOMG_17878 [Fusarium oxysporum f. sp. melonis 26406]